MSWRPRRSCRTTSRRSVHRSANWADDEGVDLIISTGGTGFTPRDVTPEAVRPLLPPGDGWLLGGVPSGQPRHRRRIDAAITRFRRSDRRHLHLLPAGLDRRLPRRLGSRPRARTRQPVPALLACRSDPAPEERLRMSRLTHLDEAGRARMVDVSSKDSTARIARAEGQLRCDGGHARAGAERADTQGFGRTDGRAGRRHGREEDRRTRAAYAIRLH